MGTPREWTSHPWGGGLNKADLVLPARSRPHNQAQGGAWSQPWEPASRPYTEVWDALLKDVTFELQGEGRLGSLQLVLPGGCSTQIDQGTPHDTDICRAGLIQLAKKCITATLKSIRQC